MVSVKELADKLHVSRQTIRNEMKRQGIKPIDGKDSYGRICFYVDEDVVEGICTEIRKRQEVREDEKPSELEQLRKEKAALESNREYLAGRYAEAAETIKALETELSQLKKELSSKEELLAAKEELIRNEKEHSDSILHMANNLSESLKASQVLAAGYQKQIEQLTAKEDQPDEAGSDHESSKRWWQFWK